MKIFTAPQIYEADKLTMAKQQLTSLELMERVANQLFNWFHLRMQGAQVRIHVFCGIGNNGGDGLALARLLMNNGYQVSVHVVNHSSKRTKEFLTNFDRLKEIDIWPNIINEGDALPDIKEEEIIIDAIFGIGLNRPMVDWVVDTIKAINSHRAFTLAVDMPSGMYMDKSPEDPAAVIKANYVLTFQAPKLPFFMPSTGKYVQQWEILDIGLDHEYLTQVPTAHHLVGKPEVLPIYQPRDKYAHKGTYGHSLIIGGGKGKVGALQLASKACLKTGAGLVTAFAPQCGVLPLQTSLPEVMVIADKEEEVISAIDFDIVPEVVAIGVGMGTDVKTQSAFEKFLKANKQSLVIDADGLNLLAQQKELLNLLPKQTVLTPHPKELERLIGKWKDDFDKLIKTQEFAAKYDCIVVIKGAHSVTVTANQYFINTTGNPGMATAGSGDVLTGMITGLISQGYPPLNAAIFGVYQHGMAGDLAVEGMGYQALIASDIIDKIGSAFIELFKQDEPTPDQGQEATN